MSEEEPSWFELHPDDAYRGGKRQHTFLKLNYDEFVNLFKVDRQTIRQWIRKKKFNPCDFKDIFRFYSERKERKDRRKTLSDLFDVNKETIDLWVKKRLFDPRDLSDIIRFYNSRHKETLHVLSLPIMQEGSLSEHSSSSSRVEDAREDIPNVL